MMRMMEMTRMMKMMLCREGNAERINRSSLPFERSQSQITKEMNKISITNQILKSLEEMKTS